MIPRIKLYSETLYPLLKWYSENPEDKDTKYAISRIIRFSSDNPRQHGIPYMYSLGALAEAKKLEIPDAEERLQWVRWKEQNHKSGLRDIGRQNGTFHQEHIVPVSQIAKKLYDLEEITVKNIHNILVNNLKIAWILKTEQRTLDAVCRSGIRTPELLTTLDIYIKGFNI
jgi:hypothetical protein